MNLWQVLRQIRYLLKARRWGGAPGAGVVFGSVLVTNHAVEEAAETLRTPVVLVRPGSASADVEQAGHLVQTVEITLAVQVYGDQTGETSLLGGARTGGQTGSGNRGLLEVEEELLAVMRVVQETLGVKILSRHDSDVETSLVEEASRVEARSYTFRVDLTDVRYYHPPMRLAVAQGAPGVATVSWALPPDRFDRYAVMIRRSAGATPPASPTAGTLVTLAVPPSVSVSDACGAGVFSWAAFAAYDETSATPTTADRYSEAEEGTTRTFTVA